MTNDQETFKRGATAAMIGLIAQIILSLVMLVGAFAVQNAGMTAAAFYFFGGIPIWIILLVIYNQHRAERIEALETEQLAQTDADAAALFNEHAEELQLSRKRLVRLYKWGLNIVGGVVAVYLLIVGGVLLYSNYNAFEQGSLADGIIAEHIAANRSMAGGTLLVVGLVITLVIFLIARYISGMTRIRQWQLLRGGASFFMGNALFALLITAAAAWFLFNKGSTQLFVYLALVLPALLILIGAEMFLLMLMGMYRPRKADEVPRPAFDSRLLGFLTSPESLGRIVSETINYQFGFEISRSWFYRLLAKAMTPLLLFGAVMLFALSCVVIVHPHEQAIITRFGEIQPYDEANGQNAHPPGLHIKLPWPISRSERYAIERVHQISVGSITQSPDRDKPILWTKSHAESEEYLVTPAARSTPVAEGNQTDDIPGLSLAAAEVIVQFKVKDLDQFVNTAPDPEQLGKALAQRERWEARGQHGPGENEKRIDPCPLLSTIARSRVVAYFARHDLDALLSTDRDRASAELQDIIQRAVSTEPTNLGIEIVSVGLTGVHPPQNEDEEEGTTMVAKKYHEQIAALQEAQSTIELARKKASQILTTAAGSNDLAHQLNEAIRKVESLRQSGGSAEAIETAERDAFAMLDLIAKGKAGQTIDEARAYRLKRPLAVRSEISKFRANEEAFAAAPRYFRQRLYLDTLAEHLPNTRRYIFSNKLKEEAAVFEFNLQEQSTDIGEILSEGDD